MYILFCDSFSYVIHYLLI